MTGRCCRNDVGGIPAYAGMTGGDSRLPGNDGRCCGNDMEGFPPTRE